MKLNRVQTILGMAIYVIGLEQTARAQFNTLEVWGNAAGTDPEAAFTDTAGTFAITAGGQDFYGTSDNGVMLWDNTGTQTTTGDFTATVRHVSTTNPALEWGRDGIMVRATQNPGQNPAELSANDSYWMTTRKSNGHVVINRRSAVGDNTYRATDVGNAEVEYNSDTNDRPLATGDVSATPWFLSAGREGNFVRGGYAMDLGGGVPGRWIEHWGTDVEAVVGELQGEVIVGLAHQSHPQTISPDENDINTATFDNWSYAGTYSADKFGVASGADTWQVAGTVQASAATGVISGSAYVSEGGTATADPVKWTVSVYPLSSFTPKFGTSGSRKDLTAPVDETLLVPAANFRQGGEGSAAGLTADIYLNPSTTDPITGTSSANANTLAANLALMTAPGIVKTSTVISSPFWSAGNYPLNEEGENVFAKAHEASGAFAAAQDNYGVEMKGQIFIPADANRKQPNLPGEFVIFKDGTDDFCYLEIDGKPLINDNDWTGTGSTDNGGGNVAVLDVSDAKYDDGEWVSFRMIMWEGGGGDNVALYWSVSDDAGVFTQESVPGTFGNLVPAPGVANSRKDSTLMEPEDLVPPADFRHTPEGGGAAQPGLRADVFNGGYPGSFDAANNTVQGEPAGTSILPNINWYNTLGRGNYPKTGEGANFLADAGIREEVDENGNDAGSGYIEYGVNLTGEIFIPGDAERTVLPVAGGNNLVLFKDGVDDFTYLEIDGQVLTNDNDWTGPGATDNGGGHVTLMDVSDPKFDDGEWVSFRMMTWEGGGGDSGVLYWSARDTNGTFGISSVPGSTAPSHQATGATKVGSDAVEARFGEITLPAGDWLTVLDIQNTGASLQRLSTVSVTGAPGGTAPAVTAFSYDPATSLLNLGFTSDLNSKYVLEYTIGFQAAGGPGSAEKWNVVSSHSDITGAAGVTNIVPLNVSTLVAPGGLLPDSTKAFFRIRRL